MEFVMGLIIGVLGTMLYKGFRKENEKKSVSPPTRAQRQLWHEYQNFLSYDGDEQAEFSE